MKLLVDLTSLYDHLSGMERFAMCLTRALMKTHPEHEYILVFKNEVHPAFRGYCVTSVILPCGSGTAAKLIFAQGRLPLALARIPADRYIFPAFPAPWLFSRRCISAIHDLSDFECYEGKPLIKRLYPRIGIRHTARTAQGVLTVSQFSKGRIMEVLGVPAERITVIYNAADDVAADCSAAADGTAPGAATDGAKSQALASDSAISAGPSASPQLSFPENYILSLSTLEPRKNLQLLIRAFLRLKREAPALTQGLKLVLAGRRGWNLKQVLGDAAPLDSEDIVLTGFVDDALLPELYRAARLFVFPSRYEGFGIPPLEAMRWGTPVLSSNAASMPEVLGDAAMYFASEDEDDLVRKLRLALQMDEAERAQRIRQGSARAREFSWEKSAEALNEMLELKR